MDFLAILREISMKTIIRSIKSSLPLLLAVIIATFLLAESVPFGLKAGIWVIAATHFTLCFWFHRRNEQEAISLTETPARSAGGALHPQQPQSNTRRELSPDSKGILDTAWALNRSPSAEIFGSGKGAQDWRVFSAENSNEPCSAKSSTTTTSA